MPVQAGVSWWALPVAWRAIDRAKDGGRKSQSATGYARWLAKVAAENEGVGQKETPPKRGLFAGYNKRLSGLLPAARHEAHQAKASEQHGVL